MLDLIVDRREMKAAIANALRFMGAKAVAGQAPVSEPEPQTEIESEPATQT
jgi:hypothetical protein